MRVHINTSLPRRSVEAQLADAMMVSNIHVDEDYVKVGINYSWKPRIRTT